MHNQLTHSVDSLSLTAHTRTIEEVLLLLGECDLSHYEGDESDLRDRAGEAAAFFFGETNVIAHRAGVSMDELPYDDGDIAYAASGEMTSREGRVS